MVDLSEEYVGSSCVVKAKNNELITLGVLRRIGKAYIDIGNFRNKSPMLPYREPVKIEVYHARLGFRVMNGQAYLSSGKLLRLIELKESAEDERREFFRVGTGDAGIIYNCMRGEERLDIGGPAGYNGLKIRLVDISLGGLMFVSKEHFEVGDRFSIVIPAMKESMLYACQVRRVVERPDGTTGYGCKLMDMEIKQEDLLHRYLLKRQRDQLQKIR